ncbi:MAG: hypothetical protein IAF58_15175 [Leptolyngbya sp.]|nr:hypothetical protein [Candidatus Melainabacteria bacterium]
MSQRPLPRYFVSRANDDSFADCLSSLDPCHAIDSFFVGGRHITEREWVVTIDSAGYLRATEGDRLDTLPAVVQQDLAFNEVIGSAASRTLDCSQVYTFYMEALEQPPETPGLNDPVYLFGTLYGPFPSSSAESQRGVEGQLTINRLDLLAGVVDGARYAFNYQDASTNATQRCFNLLVPGDREEEIAQGKGLVMAYPLMPTEVVMGEPWNEIVVSGLIFDLLSALKEDMALEKVSHPLRKLVLPVPNRAWLEHQLETNGWSIKGNMAIRKAGAHMTLPRMLKTALGELIQDRMPIPEQGTIDDFISVAAQTLNELRDFPTSRIKTLRNRVRTVSAEARAHGSRSKSAPSPTIRTPQGQNLPPQTAANRKPRNNEWMQDFIEKHRPQDAGETRLTMMSNLAAAAKPPETKLKTKPDWMNDFSGEEAGKENISPASGETKKERKNEKIANENQGSADWMNDFK